MTITNDTEVTITLALKHVEVVQQGLLELPGKICNPTFGEVDRQVRAQLAALQLPGSSAEVPASLG